MKALLLAAALFFSTASLCQEVYSEGITEWFAAPTQELFVFQENTLCDLPFIKPEYREKFFSGYYTYHGKKGKLCWSRDRVSFFGIHDDGEPFNIPWWYVFPRRTT